MESAHFLKDLAVVLCVAAATTVLFQRLRQPVVLGYVLAGMIVGPHIPVPLVADIETIHTLSELGVILLMFSIGLEFSIRKLVRIGPSAGLTTAVQVSFMLWLGYLAGQFLGWTRLESIFTGAIVAISSTMIVAKSFAVQRVPQGLADFVFGVLIFEDLVAVLLLAVLTALAAGSKPSAAAMAATVGRLGAFLIGLLVIGLLVVPRTIRAIARLQGNETLLVASVGISFAAALLAQWAGYSVALGAFVAGSLVAESGEGPRVEHLIEPLRDMFAAIFFISVGMLIDPAVIARNWVPVVALTCVVVIGQVLSVSVGTFLTGHGVRMSIQAGMSLAQIGEFSFVIAGVGMATGATGQVLYPVAVAVSGLTALLTPWLIRTSGPVANYIDRRLPRPLQTFVTFYGSWVEGLRAARPRDATRSRVGRSIRILAIDTACLIALVIGTSLSLERLVRRVQGMGTGPIGSRLIVLMSAVVLSLPFWLGLIRASGSLSAELAQRAIPGPPPDQADLGAAPRSAVRITWQVSILLLVAMLLLALTQPFLPRLPGPAIFLILLGLVGATVWHHVADFHGHVRAGAQLMVETLAAQGMPQAEVGEADGPAGLDEVRKLLPGLGTLSTLQLPPDSTAVGRTLGALNLRGQTGATVLALQRGSESVVAPGARQSLLAGDVLVLAGTEEAVAATRQVLEGSAR